MDVGTADGATRSAGAAQTEKRYVNFDGKNEGDGAIFLAPAGAAPPVVVRAAAAKLFSHSNAEWATCRVSANTPPPRAKEEGEAEDIRKRRRRKDE